VNESRVNKPKKVLEGAVDGVKDARPEPACNRPLAHSRLCVYFYDPPACAIILGIGERSKVLLLFVIMKDG
jgi:hypothetical protein